MGAYQPQLRLAMTQQRTLEQNTRFHALVFTLRLTQEEKRNLVREHSNLRTDSSKDLTLAEMQLLIRTLETMVERSITKMRSKIINIAKDVGLNKPPLLPGEGVGGEVDFARLNVFLEKKFKKKLHQLTRDELRDAVTAMEKWRDSNTKKQLGL
jgi:hypothetical protein